MSNWIKVLTMCIIVMLLMTGCNQEKTNTENKDTRTENRNEENDSNMSDNYIEETEGGLAERLGIPESVTVDIPVGDSGLSAITIADDNIEVLAADRVYTVDYEMDNVLVPDRKREIITIFFGADADVRSWDDKSNNIYDVSTSELQETFESSNKNVDYEADVYMVEYDGFIYIVDFCTTGIQYNELTGTEDLVSIANDESRYSIIRWFHIGEDEEQTEDTFTEENDFQDNTTQENVTEEYAENTEEKEWVDILQDYINKLGYEMKCTRIYKEYFKFYPSVNEQLVYRFNPYNFSINSYKSYNDECSAWIDCEVDEKGLKSFYSIYSMKKKGDLQEINDLISWDEVVEIAKNEIPKQFMEYPSPYRTVTFNDIKLCYFRILTDDTGKHYRIIPVYIFSQMLNSDSDADIDMPDYVIMIDATNGKMLNFVPGNISGNGWIEE